MKKISWNMKSFLKRATYGLLVLSCVVTMAACKNDSVDPNNNQGSNENTGDSTSSDRESTSNISVSNLLDKTNPDAYTAPEGVTFNKSGDPTLPLLSKADIRKLLADTDPETTWPDNFYAETPKTTQPYSAGKLTEEALNSGLNRLNVMRRLSGVHPVVLDQGYTENAQIGALILGINKKGNSHNPPKPTGMDDATYKKGSDGVGHGNLSSYNLPASVDNWQLDPGQGENFPGHRVWSMLPISGKVGFGYVEGDPTARAAAQMTGWTSLRACDSSARGSYEWDFAAWPAPGYFPIGDIFPANHKVPNANLYTSPWLIIFNEGKGPATPKIILTRTRDGQTTTWSIEESEDNSGDIPKKSTKKTGNIDWKVHLNGLGAAAGYNMISFLPKDADYQEGDVYKVEVLNIAGYPAETVCSYTVEFFNQ